MTSLQALPANSQKPEERMSPSLSKDLEKMKSFLLLTINTRKKDFTTGQWSLKYFLPSK